jgi:hypothetical protein
MMKSASLLFAALALLLPVAGCETGSRPRRDGGGTVDDDTGSVGSDAPVIPLDVPPYDAGPRPPADDDNDGLSNDDELARGTDPANPDTDGDGYEDGVEVLAETDPTSAASFIPPEDFYVVLPYNDPEQHRELDFRARLGRADIFFLVDTTGSMGLAINNVRTSLATTIVPAIGDAIADAVMGVGDFRDFPVMPFGDAGDWPVVIRQAMTADVSAVQTALNGLRAGGGGDVPEASTEGLYASVAGTCTSGTGFGGACFRAMSHPIIVHVTDADFHNGPTASNDYGSAVASARGWTSTIDALNAQMVRVVGVAVDSAPFPLPFPIPVASRDDLDELARRTSSRGVSGALTVYTAPSGTVSTSVVDGIVDLVGAAQQDVSSRNEDDPSDTVDATTFIHAVTPLRATRATRFDATTFYGVSGGTTVTFDVTFQNTTVPGTGRVQIYRAYIEVFDVASSTGLDRRNVYVVIPPEGGILF